MESFVSSLLASCQSGNQPTGGIIAAGLEKCLHQASQLFEGNNTNSTDVKKELRYYAHILSPGQTPPSPALLDIETIGKLPVEVQESVRREFLSRHFQLFVTHHVLASVLPNWAFCFSIEEKEALLDPFFDKGPPLATLMALTHGLRHRTAKVASAPEAALSTSEDLENQVNAITQGDETKYIAVLLARFIGNLRLDVSPTAAPPVASRWTEVMYQLLSYSPQERALILLILRSDLGSDGPMGGETGGAVWKELLTTVGSLPDRVSNVLKRQTPRYFQPIPFYSALAQHSFDTLTQNSTSLWWKIDGTMKKGEVVAGEVKGDLAAMVGQVLAKLCSIGRSDVAVKYTIAFVRKSKGQEGLPQTVAQILDGMASNTYESFFHELLVELSSPPNTTEDCTSILQLLLKNKLLSNTTCKFLLTNKFIVSRQVPNLSLLRTLVALIRQEASDLAEFASTFAIWIDVWASSSFIGTAPFEQQKYLTVAINTSINYFSKAELEDPSLGLLSKIVEGVHQHLLTALPNVRRLGMITGERFAEILGTELKFDADTPLPDEPSIYSRPGYTEPATAPSATQLEPSEMPSKSERVRSEDLSVDGYEMPSLDSLDPDAVYTGGPSGTLFFDATGNAIQGSDEGELKPMGSLDDDYSDLAKKKAPVYLRECLTDLRSDDPDTLQVTLSALNQIIRSEPDDLDELSAALASILLHLGDDYNLPHFASLRRAALVSLLVTSTPAVASYLSAQFYEANYSLSHRIDVLDFLTDAAYELAGPIASRTQEEPSKPLISVVESKPSSAMALRDQKIADKTRRFASSSQQRRNEAQVPSVNRFAQNASHFFFNLLRNFDRPKDRFDILASEPILLGKLVYTLGVFIECASLANPKLQDMVSQLLPFLCALRYHKASVVRRAIFVTLHTLAEKVPTFILFDTETQSSAPLPLGPKTVVTRMPTKRASSTENDMKELILWAQSSTAEDPDDECKKLAIVALVSLARRHQQFTGAEKIYTGVKLQTKEQRSVWTFDKKTIEKLKKPDQDKIVAQLNKEFQNLARLRHPLVLTVSRAVEESQGTIFCETEPIFASLGNVLRQYKNIPSPIPQALSRFHLDPLEIKLGLIQVCEAVAFLHANAQLIHLNITPESIFITPEAFWKLGGFAFSSFTQYKDQNEGLFKYPDSDSKDDFPTRPNLDYLAPEFLFINRYDFPSDMFSIGCVVYELFEGRALLNCKGNATVYKKAIETLFPVTFDKTPAQVRPVVEGLLTIDPAKRWTAQQVLASEFLNDMSVRVLKFLASIVEKDDRSKAEFFKGLQTALPHFPLTVIEKKVLPPLLVELRNLILVPLILPNLFAISEMLDKSIFVTRIFPALTPLFAVKDPFQVILSLLQRVDFFIQRLPEKEVNEQIISLISIALDHEKLEVKAAALKVVVPILHLFDYDKLKNVLLPRLQLICLSRESTTPIRVSTLLCYSKLVPFFNRPIVEESILPIIFQSAALDRSPAVLIGVVGVCDVASKKFGEEMTATRLIPLITPLWVEPTLSRAQFDTFVVIYQGMVDRLLEARKREFDQQQKQQDKDAQQGKMQDFDRFQSFSQLVKSNTNVPAPAQAPTATAPNPTPIRKPGEMPPDSAKVESFQTLIQKQERMREKAVEQRRTNSLLDFTDTPSASQSPLQPSSAGGAAEAAVLQPTSSVSKVTTDLWSALLSPFSPTPIAAPTPVSPTLAVDGSTSLGEFSLATAPNKTHSASPPPNPVADLYASTDFFKTINSSNSNPTSSNPSPSSTVLRSPSSSGSQPFSYAVPAAPSASSPSAALPGLAPLAPEEDFFSSMRPATTSPTSTNPTATNPPAPSLFAGHSNAGLFEEPPAPNPAPSNLLAPNPGPGYQLSLAGMLGNSNGVVLQPIAQMSEEDFFAFAHPPLLAPPPAGGSASAQPPSTHNTLTPFPF